MRKWSYGRVLQKLRFTCNMDLQQLEFLKISVIKQGQFWTSRDPKQDKFGGPAWQDNIHKTRYCMQLLQLLLCVSYLCQNDGPQFFYCKHSKKGWLHALFFLFCFLLWIFFPEYLWGGKGEFLMFGLFLTAELIIYSFTSRRLQTCSLITPAL